MMVLGKLDCWMEKRNKVGFLPLEMNVESKWIKDLKMKGKTIKLIWKKI